MAVIEGVPDTDAVRVCVALEVDDTLLDGVTDAVREPDAVTLGLPVCEAVSDAVFDWDPVTEAV